MEGRSSSWQLQLPHAVHPEADAERAMDLLGGGAAQQEQGGQAVEGDGYVSDDDEDLFGGPRY